MSSALLYSTLFTPVIISTVTGIFSKIFSKIMHCLPVPCHHTVYNAFILSTFSYKSAIYPNTTMKFIQPLMVTQNKILKILQIKNIRSPLNTQCSEFGVLKPEGLHHFNIQCNVHKLSFPTCAPCGYK